MKNNRQSIIAQSFSRLDEKTGVTLLVVFYMVLFSIMALLRYHNMHSTFFDLGVYENKIWRIAFNKEYYLLFYGHASPVLLIHAVFYRIFPFTDTLILLQSFVVTFSAYLVFILAKIKLKGNYPLIIVFAYLAYFSVEYNVLFDFHPDHIIIPIILTAFIFLEKKKTSLFAVSCLAGLMIKEPFALVISALGIYAAIKHKIIYVGAIIAIISFAAFFVEVRIILPFFTPGVSTIMTTAVTKFGSGITGILLSIPTNPGLWIREVFSKAVLKYFLTVFAPLLFLPLLSPVELIVALPMFFILIISGGGLLFSIPSQYLASIIPVLFTAYIFAIKKIEHMRYLPFLLIMGSLFSCFILSPIPGSISYCANDESSFSHNAYNSETRNIMIAGQIERLIPANPNISVVAQNSVNIGCLARRISYEAFPRGIANANYIVLDTKRPLFVFDRIDRREYSRGLEFLRKTRTIEFEYDGFLIFGAKKSKG